MELTTLLTWVEVAKIRFNFIFIAQFPIFSTSSDLLGRLQHLIWFSNHRCGRQYPGTADLADGASDSFQKREPGVFKPMRFPIWASKTFWAWSVKCNYDEMCNIVPLFFLLISVSACCFIFHGIFFPQLSLIDLLLSNARIIQHNICVLWDGHCIR